MHADVPTPTRHARAAAPPTWIRGAVREVLDQAPGYQALDKGERQSLAHAMVRVSALAARLIEEEGDTHAGNDAPLARAQSQPDFGAAVDRIPQATQNILNAVSFPRFVTDLINGVFRAMLDSSQAQMQQYVNLLNAVSASAEGFEGGQFGLVRVRQWVADQFPESIEYEAPEIEPGETLDPDEIANTRLRLRSGSSMPPVEVVRAMLGIAPEEPLEASTPEQLVPLARRHLARQRQQMLATMVMMGMQRIVIDSGKINAAMRFHIDTRSAANQGQGSQTSVQNRVKAGGSFGVGPWGASAEIENTIGYVSTQRTQSTEEMNTDLELNSSVELNFRSDYLPLNQMANQAQAERIRNSTINPVATAVEDPAAAQAARLAAQRAAEDARRTATRGSISVPVAAIAPVAAAPATAAPATAPRPITPAVTPAATPATDTAPAARSPAAPAPAVTATPEAPAAARPAVPPAAVPPATGSAAAGSSTSGHTVGTHVGAAVGEAAGTAAGGVVGGAIGTAVGGLLGGAIGGAIDPGRASTPAAH